ncbi:serpin (serine protease inhibitor) domain-containing protein [Phthorimaea operculella]|nr:serpin (serine protease inhibitor) domain-containing protein [Phthorimaea operculella]
MMLLFLMTILAAAVMADDTAIQKILQDGNNQLTAKMLYAVAKEVPGKDVAMSAFSVLTPLAQLALASEGPSHDELLNAIGMTSNDQVKEAIRYVKKKLSFMKGAELKMASRIYIANNYEIQDHFQRLSRELFRTSVKHVDFHNKDVAAMKISKWVEYKTNHVIKEMINPDQLKQDTLTVIVNAIYFKGAWMSEFNKAADSDFHVTQGKTIRVPTMAQDNQYSYAESLELNCKLLRLPYVGNTTSMLVILPNDIDGLDALVEKLQDPEAISRATKSMTMEDVHLELPKFRIETKIDLKQVLNDIGVTKVFTSDANLSHLLKGVSNVPITGAIQKAYLDVNEKGTEAGAANAFVAATSSYHPLIKEFIVNRPFYLQLEMWEHGNYYAFFNALVRFADK